MCCRLSNYQFISNNNLVFLFHTEQRGLSKVQKQQESKTMEVWQRFLLDGCLIRTYKIESHSSNTYEYMYTIRQHSTKFDFSLEKTKQKPNAVLTSTCNITKHKNVPCFPPPVTSLQIPNEVIANKDQKRNDHIFSSSCEECILPWFQTNLTLFLKNLYYKITLYHSTTPIPRYH